MNKIECLHFTIGNTGEDGDSVEITLTILQLNSRETRQNVQYFQFEGCVTYFEGEGKDEKDAVEKYLKIGNVVYERSQSSIHCFNGEYIQSSHRCEAITDVALYRSNSR